MKLEDIDQIFKDNERQFDKLPPEQVWHKLEQRLAQGQTPVAKTQSLFSKRSTWLYAAAAAIIILFLTPFTINLINKDASKSNEQIALLNNQATEATSRISPHTSLRVESRSSITVPTAPVAPTTANVGLPLRLLLIDPSLRRQLLLHRHRGRMLCGWPELPASRPRHARRPRFESPRSRSSPR